MSGTGGPCTWVGEAAQAPACSMPLAASLGDPPGAGVTVALLDTGVDARHPDLAGKVIAFRDLVGGQAVPYDDHGHGTHLAGVIAGRGLGAPAARGVAPGASLVAVKVLGAEGEGDPSTVAEGLRWCLAHRRTLGIRVVNLSLGSPCSGFWREDPLCRMAAEAWRAGLAVVASAGGRWGGSGWGCAPAAVPELIAVAPRHAPFPPRGSLARRPDLVVSARHVLGPAAFGGRLAEHRPDLRRGEGYLVQSGASVATALVSGLAAALLGAWPDLRPDALKEVLRVALAPGGFARPLAAAVDRVRGLGSRPLALQVPPLEGEDVRLLQALLRAFPGPAPEADGRYGPATQEAVVAYARAMDLEPWSPPFWQSLGVGWGPEGALWGGRRLAEGYSGADVQQLQGRLAVLGSLRAVPTGYFDRTTAAALRRWQGGEGLAAGGTLDRESYRRLTRVPLGCRPLGRGMGGMDVLALQRRLGVHADPPGRFGPATARAVRQMSLWAGGPGEDALTWAGMVHLGRLPHRRAEKETARRRENLCRNQNTDGPRGGARSGPWAADGEEPEEAGR